jgi:hypothetical protein
MSNRNIAEQLKTLQHERAGGSPDARWLLSTKETLLMQIRNTVSSDVKSQESSVKSLLGLLRFLSPVSLKQMAAVPALLVVLAIGANLGASAVMIAAEHSLPGHSLYEAKLLAENVTVFFSGKLSKAERRLEISERRLHEMVALAAGFDADKDEKMARVAGLFSEAMADIRSDLNDLKQKGNDESAVRIALVIDAKTDEFQSIARSSNLYARPSFRLALSGIDQTSVRALEVLVEKYSAASNVLPEATLTSSVGKKIESLATSVSVTDTVHASKAKAAAEEAKILLSQGDFKAAVRKVLEGTEIANDTAPEESTTSTESATATPETKTEE